MKSKSKYTNMVVDNRDLFLLATNIFLIIFRSGNSWRIPYNILFHFEYKYYSKYIFFCHSVQLISSILLYIYVLNIYEMKIWVLLIFLTIHGQSSINNVYNNYTENFFVVGKPYFAPNETE